jgi:SMI1/KNR4 family protein SUKH-1
VLDKGVIPFAQDVGHDVFCFDCREDYDRPSVMFWGQGFGTLPLAPSFSAFLELLHDAG